MSALLYPDEAARLVPGEQLVIVRPGVGVALPLPTPGWGYRAPQAWVALTGPCPTCGGVGSLPGDRCWNPDCRDGRRIVPLYTECPKWRIAYGLRRNCRRCNGVGRVLAGRGSIEVVPVTDAYHKASDVQPTGVMIELGGETLYWMPADFPLPVPGCDFGIVIDCTELAS